MAEENMWLAILTELAALRECTFGKRLDNLKIKRPGTPLFDLNGEILFRRFPLISGDLDEGYIDVAMDERIGNPLQSVVLGEAWNEGALLEAAGKVGALDDPQFVVYEFPKVGLRPRIDKNSILSVPELYSVPELLPDEFDEAPYRFRRSFLDSLSKADSERMSKFRRRWLEVAADRFGEPSLVRYGSLDMAEDAFRGLRVDEGILQFSKKAPSHKPCLELRGQVDPYFCSAACAEMVLDFYRYEYCQRELAGALGLVEDDVTSQLECSREQFRLVESLESASCGALQAWMNPCPESFWGTIVEEISSNRPLIIFANGHSRVVVGYIRISLSDDCCPKRGLVLFDPLPLGTGKLVCWEDFDRSKYSLVVGASLRNVG